MTDKMVDFSRENFEEIIKNIYHKINAVKAYNSRIVGLSSPETLSLTFDGSWYTYDFTSLTSADARGVFLGVYLYRASGSNYTGYLYTAIYNNTAWEGIVRIRGESDGYEIGGTITQPIDNQQRMNYCGVAATETVKLLGYWE